MINTEEIVRVGNMFGLCEPLRDVQHVTNGHINTSYLATFGDKRYIVQKINRYVFSDPQTVMHNIDRVTHHLRKKIREEGGDPEKETLRFLRDENNRNYIINDDGSFWRISVFIEGTTAYNKVENTKMLYNAGLSFGKFQRRLADFPLEQISETIPDFHNTQKRMEKFFIAVKNDPYNRVHLIKDEIEFFFSHKDRACRLIRLQQEGKIPVRVTHNDTKYNNILIDNQSYEAVCVIDLDTVMPGISCYDFGDAIRFAASTAAEDEQDLDRVALDMNLFTAFTEGFIGGSEGFFTQAEVENMALGAINVTIELASRFLLDYICGDLYFNTSYEGQNLDRARNQIRLAYDMEKKYNEMSSVVLKSYLAKEA